MAQSRTERTHSCDSDPQLPRLDPDTRAQWEKWKREHGLSPPPGLSLTSDRGDSSVSAGQSRASGHTASGAPLPSAHARGSAETEDVALPGAKWQVEVTNEESQTGNARWVDCDEWMRLRLEFEYQLRLCGGRSTRVALDAIEQNTLHPVVVDIETMTHMLFDKNTGRVTTRRVRRQPGRRDGQGDSA